MLPPKAIRRLSGFGQTSFNDAYVHQPTNRKEVLEAIELAKTNGTKVVLRGSGLSYGDPATASECVVIDCTRMNRILSWSPISGEIHAESGATLEEIWRHALPDGWFVPVVSGTTKVTLAGAIAMNIHGKNHLRRGNFAESVTWMEVMLVSGEILELERDDPRFVHFVSTAGLLGIILSAKIVLKSVVSGFVDVTAKSCKNWHEQFEAFECHAATHEYMVSWVDEFAYAEAAGRGVFHAANHSGKSDAASMNPSAQALPSRIMGIVPKSEVWRILKLLNRPLGMRVANALKHLAGRLENGRTKRQSLAKFNFLLDYVPGWQRSYLPAGLIQCQIFVPAQAALETFRYITTLMQESKQVAYLAVMKKHRASTVPTLFEHALDGYSLALDFRASDAASEVVGQIYEVCLRVGGKFYFAKDSQLTVEQATEWLGSNLAEFKRLKNLYDADGLLTSDLAVRLALVMRG